MSVGVAASSRVRGRAAAMLGVVGPPVRREESFAHPLRSRPRPSRGAVGYFASVPKRNERNGFLIAPTVPTSLTACAPAA